MKAGFELRKVMEGVNPGVASVSKKINKKKHSSSDSDGKDKQEIKAYLNKLQELVPFMPKNKKLSNAEVISYVIEYIRELRVTLGLPPCSNPDFDMDMMTSPALMMTMTMVARKGQIAPEHSSGNNVATSISGSVPVSPVTAATLTAQPIQQSGLQSNNGRQPLGVILNPRNCTTAQTPNQAFPKFTTPYTIPAEK